MVRRRAPRQFSAIDGYAALLERDRMEEVPSADLLAEEREMASQSRWWRPWWLRAGFSGEVFTGQKGTVMAVVLLAGVGGLLVWMMATGGGRSGLGGDLSAWDGNGEYSLPGDAGRVLRAAEVEVALAFGEPVELGVGGLPVVVHAATGVERELTVMEVDFFHDHGTQSLGGVELGTNQVVWNPGPQGWGMWWRETAVEEVARPELGFTREGWRIKQEEEMEWLFRRLESAFLVLNRLEDPLVRERGLGAELGLVLDSIVDRYPIVRERRGVVAWAGIPLSWVCLEELEFGSTGGISQGCPSVEYQQAVSEVWGSAGALFVDLSGTARLLSYMDGLSTHDYFRSGKVPELYLGLIDTIEVEGVNLGFAVRALRILSGYEGMYFSVELFGDGGG